MKVVFTLLPPQKSKRHPGRGGGDGDGELKEWLDVRWKRVN